MIGNPLWQQAITTGGHYTVLDILVPVTATAVSMLENYFDATISMTVGLDKSIAKLLMADNSCTSFNRSLLEVSSTLPNCGSTKVCESTKADLT